MFDDISIYISHGHISIIDPHSFAQDLLTGASSRLAAGLVGVGRFHPAAPHWRTVGLGRANRTTKQIEMDIVTS